MKLSALSTAAFAVGLLAASQATAQTTPPAGWTCDPDYFDSDDGCDCGCGVADPDCADATFGSCDYEFCPDEAGTQVPDRTNPTACVANACGDGTPAGDEDCDDGNTAANDGCSATCTEETGFECSVPLRADANSLTTVCVPVICGDSSVDGDESCDDGNTTPNDGCDATCTEEVGFACVTPGQPCQQIICGDGSVDGNEDCDDGNAVAGDGCDATCSTVEDGFSCPFDGGPCLAVPEGWTCNDSYYGTDDDCDCGCGVLDAECPGTRPEDCDVDDCSFDEQVNPNDISQCITAAEGEGEGEGENPGEGEGENPGEGEGENPRTQDDDEPEEEGGICAAGPAAKAPMAALLLALAALSRRRRR